MEKLLIMREPLIVQEAESGRSWTSKVFNIVIILDTYQFFKNQKCTRKASGIYNLLR